MASYHIDPIPSTLDRGEATQHTAPGPTGADAIAVRMLTTLPIYFWDDAFVRRYLHIWAVELDRLEQWAEALRLASFPQHASLAQGTLPILERQYGVVSAPNASEAERQAAVMAVVSGRHVASRLDWQEAITRVVGATWAYYEGPGDYEITVQVPFDPSPIHIRMVGQFIRSITPAHLDLTITDLGGFRVGISRLDIDPL